MKIACHEISNVKKTDPSIGNENRVPQDLKRQKQQIHPSEMKIACHDISNVGEFVIHSASELYQKVFPPCLNVTGLESK